MRTRTVKLEGRISSVHGEHTFEYPLGSIEAITSGRWELAIANITFIFGRGDAWNTIYEVSTNYIDTVTVDKNNVLQREPMTLTFFRAKGQPEDKVMLGFRWRDFFEITSPSKVFKLMFNEIREPETVQPIGNGSAFVSVLVILRRFE